MQNEPANYGLKSDVRNAPETNNPKNAYPWTIAEFAAIESSLDRVPRALLSSAVQHGRMARARCMESAIMTFVFEVLWSFLTPIVWMFWRIPVISKTKTIVVLFRAEAVEGQGSCAAPEKKTKMKWKCV